MKLVYIRELAEYNLKRGQLLMKNTHWPEFDYYNTPQLWHKIYLNYIHNKYEYILDSHKNNIVSIIKNNLCL